MRAGKVNQLTESFVVKSKARLPGADDFSKALGQVTWLMTLSKAHRDKSVGWIEAHVSAPLMFRQVRVFLRDKQPVAAIIWAYASNEVKARLEAGDHQMALADWRSGEEVVIVECISPLMNGQPFIDNFMADVRAAQQRTVGVDGSEPK